ncbi:hypothetical protein N657DRAFT_8413 [Parathielavia appendiculata]|uniref:Uncharacterized protein n=1 Tax=Parathielavia appendiculata TaxID=2587402 RepID=A0AAN6Z872_9PEZI|nr:hypothetical protein N657DRAFT_8413 [Parathielavia appendiculata]
MYCTPDLMRNAFDKPGLASLPADGAFLGFGMRWRYGTRMRSRPHFPILTSLGLRLFPLPLKSIAFPMDQTVLLTAHEDDPQQEEHGGGSVRCQLPGSASLDLGRHRQIDCKSGPGSSNPSPTSHTVRDLGSKTGPTATLSVSIARGLAIAQWHRLTTSVRHRLIIDRMDHLLVALASSSARPIRRRYNPTHSSKSSPVKPHTLMQGQHCMDIPGFACIHHCIAAAEEGIRFLVQQRYTTRRIS